MQFEQLYSLVQENFEPTRINELFSVLKKYNNRRIIFSNSPTIDKNRNFTQAAMNPRRPFQKPIGLWYALGDAWLHFMYTDMDIRLHDYNTISYVDIDYADVLRINNLEKFYKFQDTFVTQNGVDWNNFSQKYKGIEIIPMFDDFRNNGRSKSGWYDQWDIPSGCIWDMSAIKNYKVLLTDSDS